MQQIIHKAKEELEKLEKEMMSTQSHLNTSDIRQISSRLYHSLENKSIDHILSLCEELLEQRNWPMGVIAYDWAYRMKKYYKNDTFYIFETWLINYVRGWGDCDDFCTHAFGELICQHTELIDKVLKWTDRNEFWMRRAAAVILIPSIKKGKYLEVKPFAIADCLMKDKEDLVLKGYGWMLKVLSLREPQLVYDYLWKNQDIMPRVAYRYALEKMEPEKKARLMSK